jgi:hypothetical protein
LHFLSHLSPQCADFRVTKGRPAPRGRVYSGDLMSNDVQSHESVVERLPGEERRASPRHAASTLGSVTARIIGGSPVDLVNFSARGVLFECDSRLLIGARASVRITTPDANLVVSGRVVRSRVKGLVNGALRYDAALALDHELTLRPVLASDAAPEAAALANGSDDDADDVAFESELDGSFDPAPVEAYLAASEASLVEATRQDDPEAEAIALFEDATSSGDAPAAEDVDFAEPVDVHVEVAVRATLEEAQAVPPALPVLDAEVEAPAVEAAAVEPIADEPVAFEADAEIAFEPAEEFVFEEASDPAFTPAAAAVVETPPDLPVEPAYGEVAVNAIEPGPAGESMFDATPYTPPVEEVVAETSMFEATPPMPVGAGAVATMFDARPSESWRAAETGEPAPEIDEPVEAGAVVAAEADAVADGIDFETDVAFEADDAVMFESAFEAYAPPAADAAPLAPAAEPAIAAAAEPVIAAAAEAEAAAEAGVAAPVADSAPAAAPEPLVAAFEPAAIDEPPAAPDDEDRALLPFTSTVPVDLADLRRIAADNQW